MRKGSCLLGKVVKLLSSELSLYCCGCQGYNRVHVILTIIFCQAILVVIRMLIKVIIAYMI